MQILIQQLINSLSVASVTILIGIGITLIFGLAGIVNFAHGEFLMIGGMITWFLVTSGTNFFVALVGAMIFVGALGFVAETRTVPVHFAPTDERIHHVHR